MALGSYGLVVLGVDPEVCGHGREAVQIGPLRARRQEQPARRRRRDVTHVDRQRHRLNSYGPNSYGPNSYGLNSYGPYSYGHRLAQRTRPVLPVAVEERRVGLFSRLVVMACLVMALGS